MAKYDQIASYLTEAVNVKALRMYYILGDVGSNMSLYMGASLLTFLEVLVLIFRCVRFLLRRKRLVHPLKQGG